MASRTKSEQEQKWRKLHTAWAKNHQYAVSARLARAYVARYPTSGAGWLVLGECLTVSCHFSAASSALQKARKHIPADKRHFALQSTGHLWKAQGRLRRAENWYRKALELGPKDGSLIYLALCVQNQGRVNDALALFRRAARLKNDPTDEAWYNIGLILLYRGRHRDAIRAFDRAIDIDPKYKVAIEKRKEAKLLLTSRAAFYEDDPVKPSSSVEAGGD